MDGVSFTSWFGRGWLGAHRQKLHIARYHVLYYPFGQAGIYAGDGFFMIMMRAVALNFGPRISAIGLSHGWRAVAV
jgi:hypothetical protein